MEACQWLQGHRWFCRIGKVRSGTVFAQETFSLETEASLSFLRMENSCLKSNGPPYAVSFQVCQHCFWCRAPYWVLSEYSTRGPTRILYAISLNAGFCDLIFLLRKQRDRLAEVHVAGFWMWLLNNRLLLISTPRYLEPATDSKAWPYSSYWLGIGVLDLVMCRTTHFLGLNQNQNCLLVTRHLEWQSFTRTRTRETSP